MRFLNFDPQQVLPLAIVAFEAHALGDLKTRDDASLDLLASLWPGRLVAKVSFSRAARGPLTLCHYFQLAASHLHL